MRVADLSNGEIVHRLASEGIGVRLGPFDVRIVAPVASVARAFREIYADYPLLTGERIYGIHVELRSAWHWRPYPHYQVRFLVDGRAPHADMPLEHALCVLEWGINLAIALRYHCYLMLHAAVVERGGGALLLPAAPGAGKTTLCAALIHRGWRLLSDEFGLLRPGTVDLIPLPRPLPLKNESTPLIRTFAKDAAFGPMVRGTRKGDITHLRAPQASIDRATETAPARWLVFPQWRRDSSLQLERIAPPEAFALLATNAFNYETLGERGFDTVRQLVQATHAYRLEYSDLDEAIHSMNRMVDEHAG